MNDNTYAALFPKVFAFWDHITPDDRQTLLRSAKTLQFHQGDYVYGGSDDCLGMLLVTKGQLRTHLLSEEGKDVTLYRLNEGDVCVLSASCVLESITFDVFVDAYVDSEVILIGAALFHELAERNVYVQNFALQMAVRRFSDVMWAMQQILFMGVDQRLALFLKNEMEESQKDTIKATHEQIAKCIGSVREVVSRMLKYFADEGIVTLSRGGVTVIDKKKLYQFL